MQLTFPGRPHQHSLPKRHDHNHVVRNAYERVAAPHNTSMMVFCTPANRNAFSLMVAIYGEMERNRGHASA